MSDKKTILILIAIVSAVLILIAILIGIYGSPEDDVGKNNQIEENDLYFVIESEESGYGICKTNGTIVLKPEYSQIARIEDSVYLKKEGQSFLFFLNDGKSVSLGGKESDVHFVYDRYGKLLPYFILRYGETEQTSIYRIFNSKGIRHDIRDFATLNDAYKFLNAKEVFKASIIPDNIKAQYNVKATLDYPTNEGKTQFIVTKKDTRDNLHGLIDESGRIILETIYNNLSPIPGSTDAIKVDHDEKTYIFLVSEKLVEVEPGFEFIISDGYFIQKRGNTINKIYNTFGEVVIDGIYNLNQDLIPLNLKNGTSYMLVQETLGVHNLYDMTNNKKSENEYTNVLLDYMKNYKSGTKNTSFIYNNKGIYYAVDLENLQSYKMNITTRIYSPLDLGFIYKSK